MRALRKQRQAGQYFRRLAAGRRVRENRQPKRRLGHEHVAGHGLERGAGWVCGALVIAADHGAAGFELHHHLRAAQHVPGRRQAHIHVADAQGFPRRQRLLPRAGLARPHAHIHQRQRLTRGQHGVVAGPRVVGMGVRDHSPRHRAHRVDVEVARLAIQAFRADAEP